MKFNEEKHIYTNDEGVLYTSATSFIKKFTKPFEKFKIAAKFAKKHKRTIEDVLAEWEKAGNDAILKGTAYHKMLETDLLNQPFILIENENHPVFAGIYDENDGDKILGSLELEPGVYPELIVWSDRYKIAGQADYVEITKSGKINIKDYKTSKEIRQKAFQRWDGTYETLGFPFTHLEDCNFNHYALQLNLYAFLIKSHNRNLEVGTMTIEHIIGTYDEENQSFEIDEVVHYDIPNMQSDIKIGLEYYMSRMQEA